MNTISIGEFKRLVITVSEFLEACKSDRNDITTKVFKCFWYPEIIQDVVSSLPNVTKAETEYKKLSMTLAQRRYIICNQLSLLLGMRTDIVHQYRLPSTLVKLINKPDEFFTLAFNGILKLLDHAEKYWGIREIHDNIEPVTKEFERVLQELKHNTTYREVAATNTQTDSDSDKSKDLLILLCLKEIAENVSCEVLDKYDGNNKYDRVKQYLIDKHCKQVKSNTTKLDIFN